jgi:catalase
VVDGISYSPDKNVTGPFTFLSRCTPLPPGRNYEQLPVNRCPFAVNNYERDGAMRVDDNGGSNPNYFLIVLIISKLMKIINNLHGNWKQ